MERDKFVAGEFVWTGFDYLGEPTPFDRQAASSYFGIVDTCGMPKDRYYLYRSYWRPDTDDRPHPAALELAGPRRPECAGVRLHQWRQRGAVPQRQVAGPAREGARTTRRRRTSRSASRRRPARSAPRRGKQQTAVQRKRRQSRTRRGLRRPARRAEWWQIDLGGVEPVADVVLSTEGDPGDFLYRIDVSDDGNKWRTVVDHDKWHEGWGDQFTHGINTDARFIRVDFHRSQERREGRGPRLRRLSAVVLRRGRQVPAALESTWPTSRAN